MTANKTKLIKAKYLKSNFEGIDVYTFSIMIKDLIDIHYVARRGIHEEEGSVQRVLNKSRINSIRDFVLSGKVFFNTFIINWSNTDKSPRIKKETISIPIIPKSAQVIDGQHRLSGLVEAVQIDDKLGNQEVLVSMCLQLTTKQASSIFLNINSEQKPVPKSLVYDLFGILGDERHLAENRASDIATELHLNKKSPYYDYIKFPGKSGILDSGTVVTALKKHLDTGGDFAKYGLTNLEYQKKIILNYFTALSKGYRLDRSWQNKAKNPFLQSAGFYGAIAALMATYLPKCIDLKSFTVETFSSLLNLYNYKLLFKEDLKVIEGKSRRKAIQDYLESNIQVNSPKQEEYEFD